MSESDLPPIPRLPSRQSTEARPARQRALSRETIAAAALEIVDREGLDALTMRTVARALGTGAASLYAHVASKEELLEMVVERVIGEVPLPGPPDPARWQEQVKEMGRAVRSVFSRHRDLARASFARIPLGENSLRGSEWMISVLRAGGLPDQLVAFACDLFPMYVMAISYEESVYASEDVTSDVMRDFADRMGQYFASLPPDRFPNIVSLAGPLTAGDDNERFEFGMEVLIRGLIAMAGESVEHPGV